MINISCIILVFLINGQTEYRSVDGRFMRQNIRSDEYTVDFVLGLEKDKLDKSLNTQVQTVHHNACLFKGEGL